MRAWGKFEVDRARPDAVSMHCTPTSHQARAEIIQPEPGKSFFVQYTKVWPVSKVTPASLAVMSIDYMAPCPFIDLDAIVHVSLVERHWLQLLLTHDCRELGRQVQFKVGQPDLGGVGA